MCVLWRSLKDMRDQWRTLKWRLVVVPGLGPDGCPECFKTLYKYANMQFS